MSIIVKTQAELDRIPLNTNEHIYIEFGTYGNPAIVKNGYLHKVTAKENSFVAAYNNSSVEAWGNSSVRARGNSSVTAYDNSYVETSDNSSVKAWGDSSVVAWGSSSVEASDNSSVKAYGNSSVVAWGSSSVKAYGNSSVEASDNSFVKAYGNVQVVDKLLSKGSIRLLGNARKVCMPKDIGEFMDFYGIKHNKMTAIFYKAVHKQGDEYVSDYDTNFKYEIGKLITESKCSVDTTDACGEGIHISHLDWALNFGNSWENLAILELEVEIKDIVMPINSDGKVRTSKAKVIREVPLSDCGLYGKILARKVR